MTLDFSSKIILHVRRTLRSQPAYLVLVLAAKNNICCCARYLLRGHVLGLSLQTLENKSKLFLKLAFQPALFGESGFEHLHVSSRQAV